MMDAREERGLQIATVSRIKRDHGCYVVPSQTGNGKHVVRLDPYPRCSCPDYELRAVKCKHIHAVEITIRREEEKSVERSGDTEIVTEKVAITATKRTTYKQDWPAYNAAQKAEKDRFQELLGDLCGGISEPPPGLKGGRPPVPLSVRVFSAAFKVYSTLSSRRFSCDLQGAYDRGFISRLPHYNSVLRFLEDAELTPVLRSMIARSAAPLSAVETDFAVDSSGFSGSRFDRWYDHKYGGMKSAHQWVKVHLACGVKTNVVTAVEIAGNTQADSPMLPALVDVTASNFTIREVSADLAYSGNPAFNAVAKHGGMAYIPFKVNATGGAGGLYGRMFHYFSYNRDEYLSHYHKRSNVESTFSMMKAKFGDALRSKTDTAMVNETLCKVLCHNICCLIQSIYELGISATFWNSGIAALSAATESAEADPAEAWAWV